MGSPEREPHKTTRIQFAKHLPALEISVQTPRPQKQLTPQIGSFRSHPKIVVVIHITLISLANERPGQPPKGSSQTVTGERASASSIVKEQRHAPPDRHQSGWQSELGRLPSSAHASSR